MHRFRKSWKGIDIEEPDGNPVHPAMIAIFCGCCGCCGCCCFVGAAGCMQKSYILHQTEKAVTDYAFSQCRLYVKYICTVLVEIPLDSLEYRILEGRTPEKLICTAFSIERRWNQCEDFENLGKAQTSKKLMEIQSIQHILSCSVAAAVVVAAVAALLDGSVVPRGHLRGHISCMRLEKWSLTIHSGSIGYLDEISALVNKLQTFRSIVSLEVEPQKPYIYCIQPIREVEPMRKFRKFWKGIDIKETDGNPVQPAMIVMFCGCCGCCCGCCCFAPLIGCAQMHILYVTAKQGYDQDWLNQLQLGT